MGRNLTPQTKVVRSDDKAVHITAMADIQETTWTGDTHTTKLAYPDEMQGVVLFANLTLPEEVIQEGVQNRNSKRLPGFRRGMVFEFGKETESWSPSHDVKDLSPVEDKIKGRITGSDPHRYSD
jgi:hypothetical protein